MSKQEEIGFIGLGSQGGPMAHRIVDAGMALVVWARRSEALKPYVAKGAVAADSIAELGERCDHVGICVVNDADVAQVCEALIPAMRPGGRIAIHSTVLPETCTQLAAACSERGIALIDAPVSGGGPAAEVGALTVMCGGDPATFDVARPIFEAFGKLVVRLGDIGAGQRAKIINNSLLAANMGLAHGAFLAAAALDIDHDAFGTLVGESSGRSFGFELYSKLPNPAAFSVGAPLLAKDVGLLQSILPENSGAAMLTDTAAPFLAAATGS